MTPRMSDRHGQLKRLRRRLFPRSLRFTKEGRIYVLVCLGVGFGAVNTGNNLLFLVFGLMLGLIIVSGILCEISLSKISVGRALTLRPTAGAAFSVELSLTNDKRLAPSFGLELRDEIDGRPFRRRCFFLRVGAKERRAIAYRCELGTRGPHVFDGTIVASRFPFGLFEKSRFLFNTDRVLALPGDLALPDRAHAGSLGAGEIPSDEPGLGGDFRELRELVPGDDPRHIHWRASARLGRPLVRVHDAQNQDRLEIVLDAGAGPDDADLDDAERRIEAAAHLVRRHTELKRRVRLVTAGPLSLEADDVRGCLPLLEHLALLDVRQEASSPPPVGLGPTSFLIGPRASSVGKAVRLTTPSANQPSRGAEQPPKQRGPGAAPRAAMTDHGPGR